MMDWTDEAKKFSLITRRKISSLSSSRIRLVQYPRLGNANRCAVVCREDAVAAATNRPPNLGSSGGNIAVPAVQYRRVASTRDHGCTTATVLQRRTPMSRQSKPIDPVVARRLRMSALHSQPGTWMVHSIPSRHRGCGQALCLQAGAA